MIRVSGSVLLVFDPNLGFLFVFLRDRLVKVFVLFFHVRLNLLFGFHIVENRMELDTKKSCKMKVLRY